MMSLYIIDPNADLSLSKALLIALIGMAVVLAELALLALFIQLLSKIMSKVLKKKQPISEAPAISAAPVSPSVNPAGIPLPETESEGKLDLIDVDEPTAAVIMAVVSDKSGIPLNRLSFKSIKLLKEEEK